MAQGLGPNGSPRGRGVVLLGVIASAALVILIVAGGRLGAAPTELAWVDTAPAVAQVAVQLAAELDAGVDWSRVESADQDAGISVAAYER